MADEWYLKGQPPVTAAEVVALASNTILADAATAAAAAGIDNAELLIISATPGVEGAVAADTIEVVCGITDFAGAAKAMARQVFIRSLAVTPDKGDLAAAGTPVGTVLKAVNPATGENVMTMQTTAGGLFTFSVANDVAETTEVQITADGCIPRVLKLTFA